MLLERPPYENPTIEGNFQDYVNDFKWLIGKKGKSKGSIKKEHL